MLLFLYRWDYCWKYEFDTDFKIEQCITMTENNYFFIKKYISKHRAKSNALYYCKKRRTAIMCYNLFDKNCTQEKPQENVKCHNSTWRKLTWMNRHWTGKLQVTRLSAYISRKKLCSQTFKASLEEVIVMHSEKMKEKCLKDVWNFFSVTCRLTSRNFIAD